MDLTGKKKRHLRLLGKTLSAKAAVGKDGLTDEVVANVDRLLEGRELVKVRLPAGPERKAVAPELADRVGAALITIVGRTCLLYRPDETLETEQRIDFG
ncbi:MAG: YhbY family RNA-binding protein [Phycisphaerae bacterium]